MDRLQFLKAFGITVGGGLLARRTLLADVPPADRGAARYRAGAEGQILSSRDGVTWQLHTDFGDRYRVLAVQERRGVAIAEVSFEGRPAFELRLDAEGRHWHLR